MTLPTGYKTFLDDTVLPADDINGYLMQGILVFTDASDRDTSLVGNLREGQYAYLQSDKTTYVYSGTAWQRVGKQDVETTKNFQSFTASGGTSVPDWGTKMYYLVVGGGGSNAANGGQVVQGDTAVTGGTSLTVTVGGTAANSSLAISGGSTFTATGAGGVGTSSRQGVNGTQPTAPFNVGYFGGGGGTSETVTTFNGVEFQFSPASATAHGNGGFGGGGSSNSGGSGPNGSTSNAARAGAPNSGGAGGGGGGTGGSGIVLLYFS
jgi:hypothetical protein